MRRYHANANVPMRAAARIIRNHYGLTRPVTPAECEAEILNCARKRANGSLDDFQALLTARLINAGFIRE